MIKEEETINPVVYNKNIFLDIGGVIATSQSFWKISAEKQDLLEMILEKTNAKIVVSSNWRRDTLQSTIKYLNRCGFRFCNKIVGITSNIICHYTEENGYLSFSRGAEIKQWIISNVGEDWKQKISNGKWNYVILDDGSDMLAEQKNNFIQTDSFEGLTIEHVNKAIEILHEI